MFESLEQRRLLAFSSLSVSGAIITVAYTNNNDSDVVEVTLSGGNIQVRDGAGALKGQTSAAGKTRININVFGGNDFVRIGRADGSLMPATTVAVSIDGGAGNDTLIGGNGIDTLIGGADNDRLDGRASADRVEGGPGFDTIDYNYRANKVIVTLAVAGGDGTILGNNSSPAQYNDNGGDNLVDIEAVIGGTAGDSIIGNASANWLEGGGGNDTIFGGAGIDTITGGVNTDLAYGEGDADFFFFQDSTSDQFLGGPGTTTAQFDAGLDTPASAASAPSALSAKAFSSALSEALEEGVLQLDNTFGAGVNGKVLTSIGGSLAEVNNLALQRVEISPEVFEEKIIVVGSMLGTSESYDFMVARYNANGTLDTTFGEDESGIVTTDISTFGDRDSAAAVVINPNGEIIVAGTSYQQWVDEVDESHDYSVMSVAKYNADGTPDTTFGFDGVRVYEPDSAYSNDEARDIAIQYVFNGETTEEEYVIAGTIGPAQEFIGESFSFSESIEGTSDMALLRIFDFGQEDFAFGNGGLVRTDYFGNSDIGTSVAIDDGSEGFPNNIWISGYTSNNFTPANFLVAGYDEDGNPIPALTNYDFGAQDKAFDSIISGSKLLVVGETGFEGFTSGAILSVNIDETPSPYPGQVLGSSYVNDEGSVSLHSVTLDNEGDAVTAGSLNGKSYYVYRFDTDTLFGIGDPAIISFGDSVEDTATATGVAVQEDGKIVVGGLFSDPFIALARLEDVVEPPFVDETLTPFDVQNFGFFVDDDGVNPVPAYLVTRLTSLKPDGTIEIIGTNQPDNICVTLSEDGIVTVTVINWTTEVFQYNAADVTNIVIRGLDGNDYICIGSNIRFPAFIDAGKGNDTVIGGGGRDEIHGGAGNDSVDAGAGEDKVYGEGDKDTVKGGNDNDTVSGGDGDDSVDGGSGDDKAYGDAGKDTVQGGTGNDLVSGGDGDDSVDGGDANDSVYGDAGKDTVQGGIGNDVVSGGTGDDSVDGGDGQDSVYGDVGKDTVKGGNGNDLASGGDGDDSVEGGNGNDRLFGDAGKDTVRGGGEDDQVFGGAGNDSLYGDAGRDILIGGLDSDRLDGGSADDILNGGVTDFDNNPAAMSALLAEWTRPDADYNTRVNHIINGGGLNGTFKLNANTVHSAPIPSDTLTGGSNNDLFYLAIFGDRATDRISAEKIVTVHG